MITIFYIIETILIYFYSLGFSLNARPHKRQRFNHHRVEIKVVVVVVVAGADLSNTSIGDLSCSLADFGFPIQRIYFETSHAKGEQDAAGSHVKQKVSQAVLRRTATITSVPSQHHQASQQEQSQFS